MEKRRITRREILCLLILLALAAALYLHGLQRPTGGTAVIEQDGKTLHRIAFASLSETETLSVGDTVIEVGPEGARFVTSPCPQGCAAGRAIPPCACPSASASASPETAAPTL